MDSDYLPKNIKVLVTKLAGVVLIALLLPPEFTDTVWL